MRSLFSILIGFAAGFVLAASLLFFGVLRLEPPKIYGL